MAPTSPAEAPPVDALPRSAAPPATPAREAQGLRHNRDYRLWLVGQGFSAIGDGVTMTALPLLVLILTGSGVAMGVVGVLQMVPDLIFGLPAGAIADRWDRRRLMVVSDLTRAGLTALIPLSLVLGLPTMAVILTVAAPIGLMRVLFLAAYTAAVPQLVGREQIGPANSYMEAIYSVGLITGPMIAGVLTAVIGPGPTLAIDAGSFLVSALAIMLIRRRLQERTGQAETHILADIREGIGFVVRHRVLRTAIGFMTSVSIGLAAIVPAITFYITQDRRHGPDDVGFVLAAFGVGSVVGSIAASRLTRGRVGRLMIACNVGTGSLTAGVALFADTPPMLLVSLASGITSTIVLVSYITLRAASTPDALLGRVGSIARMITLGLQPVGMLTAGILLDAVGGGWTLVAMGSFAVGVSLLFALSSTLREARVDGRPQPA